MKPTWKQFANTFLQGQMAARRLVTVSIIVLILGALIPAVLPTPVCAAEIPTVTTQTATHVGTATAQLNGYLADDGGEVCEYRFEYGYASGVYAFQTPWTGAEIIHSRFYTNVSSLISDTTYYFRVQARNSMYVGNGIERSFTTTWELSSPTEFNARATSGTEISLSWMKGGGSDNTLIMMGTDTYSTSSDEGTQAYFGRSPSISVIDLTPGTTYYFSAWSESNDVYSAEYSYAMTTTLAGVPVTVPASTTEPTNWFLWPDYTRLSNLPLYSQFLAGFDAYHLPYNTGWVILALFIAALLGVAALFLSNGETWIAVITIIVAIVVQSLIGMIGLWILLVMAIIGGTYAFLKARPT